MLFKILVVEATEGNKPSKKLEPKYLAKVCEEIGEKFNINFNHHMCLTDFELLEKNGK